MHHNIFKADVGIPFLNLPSPDCRGPKIVLQCFLSKEKKAIQNNHQAIVKVFVWLVPNSTLQMIMSYICLCSLFHMEQGAVPAPLISVQL